MPAAGASFGAATSAVHLASTCLPGRSRTIVSLARAQLAAGVAAQAPLEAGARPAGQPYQLRSLHQTTQRHSSALRALPISDAGPSDAALPPPTAVSASSCAGGVTGKPGRDGAVEPPEAAPVSAGPAVYRFEDDVYEDYIALRISQSSWTDLPPKTTRSKLLRVRNPSSLSRKTARVATSLISDSAKVTTPSQSSRTRGQPTRASAGRSAIPASSRSTVRLIQSNVWRKLGPVPLPVERKHELLSLELAATRGMSPAELEEYFKLPHPAELAPTHLPISDWQIFQIDWCPDRPFAMEPDELAACKRAWERTSREDVDRIIERFRETHPEILPPDAPVWPGPSKTAKMSPAARGVFSRQWHARPENQVGMFVGSGGSGEIGRKLAFDVAYKAATNADVRACEAIAASMRAKLLSTRTESNQQRPPTEPRAALAVAFPPVDVPAEAGD